MPDWELFDDQRFELRFRYPTVTPYGLAVTKLDYAVRDAQRIHVFSEGREVYVELTRYPSMPAQEEYGRHRPDLERRWSELEISDLEETRFAGRAAHAYTFRWAEGERVAVLVRTEAALYRVLYNSRSELNAEILATFAFRERRAR